MISLYSMIMSIAFFSITLFVTGFLISHVKRVRWGLILFIFLLGLVRLLLPMEFEYAIVIRSWYVYPGLIRLLQWKIVANLTVASLLIFIYLAGVAISLARHMLRYRAIKEIVDRAPLVTERDDLYAIVKQACAALGYHGKIRVHVTKEISTAASIGFLSPVILMTEESLHYSEAENLGIIKHELTHYLRRDPGKRWAMSVAQSLLWWNPAIYYLNGNVIDMLELECDERACLGMSEEERLAYLEAIKHVLDSGKGKDLGVGMGYGQSESSGILVRRFHEVLKPCKRFSLGTTGVSAIFCILLFLASYGIIFQSAGMPQDAECVDESLLTAPAGEEEFLLLMPDGTYLYVDNMLGITYLSEKEVSKPPYNGLPVYDYVKGE